MGIKAVLKKEKNTGSRIDASALYTAIEKYSYVSFDIFDTLVKRNVAEPTDIFSLMEKYVGQGFKEKRIKAEARARQELGRKEIDLVDIYRYFPRDDRKELQKLELAVEEKTIVPNQPVVEVYRKCIEAHKTVYIVSDMYWPEMAIKRILEKNGLVGYKALYLSSTKQRVKSDGSLFHCLIKEENISPKSLVHVGDSPKGDYREPSKIGIQAIRIPRYFKNINYRGDDQCNNISINYLNNFINNTFLYNSDLYYQFGYAQFGKLLYGYVNWLHKEVRKRGIKKLFFFARDGYIIKQAYEICIDDNEIETCYLEVSRRSLRGPVLWMDCSFETIMKMVVNAKLISLVSIFDSLGLDIGAYTSIIRANHLTMNTLFDCATIVDDKRLKKLLECIRDDIIENSRKEYELLQAYLLEKKVGGKFGIVDIGYAGSMQRYLQQVLSQMGIEHDITGFYFAVADFYKKNMLPGVKLELNGYLFDFQHDAYSIDTRRSFVGLFETLFLEQGGSVKRYLKQGEHIGVERYPYEYEFAGKPSEDLLKIRKIQQGALDFLEHASKDALMRDFPCKPSEYFYGLYLTGTAPSCKDINLFGDISFYDEGITEKLAAPRGLLYYLVHLNHLKSDFLRCRWKIGFLKRLLRINLPYLQIYNILQRLR